MKLYVVMGRYLRTQDEAKARAKELGIKFNPAVDIDDVPTDQKGLVEYLNNLVAGLNSAKPAAPAASALEVVAAHQETTREPSYSERTVAFDTAFAQLPVPQQLALMNLGTDNALREIDRLNKLLDGLKIKPLEQLLEDAEDLI